MRLDGVASAAREALARPGLFLWCGVIALVDAVALGAVLLLASGRGLPTAAGLLITHRLLLVGLSAATLPGCYAIYRRERGDDASALRAIRAVPGLAARAAREGTPRLLASTLAARGVTLPIAVALAVVLGGVFFGVDTLAVWAAAAGAPVDRGLLALTAVFVSVAGAAWLVGGLLAYHDLLGLDGVARPRSAWRESAAAATARPAWAVGQALVRGVALTLPWVLAFAVLVGLGAVAGPPGTETVGLPVLLASAVVLVVAGALVRSSLVAYHVETYESRIRPAVAAGDRSVVERPRRVAIAAGVVLAAIGGVAMVRTADVAPGPDVPDAAIDPAAADATVETAVERTLSRDYAYEYEVATFDRTRDAWRAVFDGSGRIDRDAPEARLSIALHLDDGEVRRMAMYGADGIGAVTAPDGSRIRTYNPLEVRTRSGNWSAAIGRSFTWIGDEMQVLPRGTAGWHRVDSDGATITYDTSNLTVAETASVVSELPERDEDDVRYVEEPEIRIVVDRETATVRRFWVRSHFRTGVGGEDPREVRRRTTVTVTAVGDLDVERPEGLAGPDPLERLWDVVFYG